VVDLVSLGRRGEAKDCGRQAGSGETGDSCESELLHFSAFFSYLCGLSSAPSDELNSQVKRFIPVAEIDRRLAGIAARCEARTHGKGHPLPGALWSVRSSVALVHTGVDVRDNGALMDVVDPIMVSDVGVGRAREAEDSGHQAGGCDGG
jgi:hypothetical protein